MEILPQGGWPRLVALRTLSPLFLSLTITRLIRVRHIKNSIGFENLISTLDLSSVLQIGQPLAKLRSHFIANGRGHPLARQTESPVDCINAEVCRLSRIG